MCRNSENNILIVSWDLDLGGVERSLISMLSNFDYQKNTVDLYLHSHIGPLLPLLSNQVNLLPEVPESTTFRKSIKQVYKLGFVNLATIRLLAKFYASTIKFFNNSVNTQYYQGVFLWKHATKYLPKVIKEYDIAISYSANHDFTLANIQAKTKIAWIHTDYSSIDIDVKADLAIWDQFDYIISISDACTASFLKTHPSQHSKIVLVENITSPNYVQDMAENTPKHEVLEGSFNLVSVGRLSEEKAFDRAVEALHLVHLKGFTNLKWYIVGEGGDRAKIEALIKQYNLQDSFILLGSMTNPYPYIKAADLYVQPSRYEGKAVTIAEAQILAKPILITNYATSSSQIDHNIDGFICEQSVDAISETIIKLYQDETLRTRLSNYCKEQDYSNKEELKKLYRLFK